MTALDLACLGSVRTDWSIEEARAIFTAPFGDLLFHAQRAHRANFAPNRVQVSTLLSVKTGACPEDCKYCPQSVRYDTGVEREELLQLDQVVDAARAAKAQGATRFCMGAAYRSPKPKQLEQIKRMVSEVRALGLETCATVGMLTREQARELKDAGLDYYNHNLDTSKDYYGEIVTTRTYEDRLDTLQAVRDAGINVCCGGILGMGESEQDRIALRHTLATLPRGRYTWTEPPAPPVRGDALVVEHRPLPTNYILGFFHGPSSANARDYNALRVATAVLSGRLFGEIRSRRNLTYAVSAPFLERALAAGGVYVTTVSPDLTLGLIREEIQTLQQDIITRQGLSELVQQFITGQSSPVD